MTIEEAVALVSVLDAAIKAGIRKTYDPLALQMAACTLFTHAAEVEAERDKLRAELNMFREKLSNFSQEQFDRANHLDM